MSGRAASVRGTVVQRTAAALREALAAHPSKREAAIEQLGAAAELLLEGEVDPVAWYPVEVCGRALEVLVGLVGGDEPTEFLRERGAIAAEELIKGSYEPLSDEDVAAGKSLGRTLVQLGPAILNFGTWEFHLIERGVRHSLRFQGGALLPEPMRHTTAGFIEALGTRATRRTVTVTSERLGDDLLFDLRLG